MKALVSSLNFSPGHYSHVIALKKAIELLGIDVSLLLDQKYRALFRDTTGKVFSKIEEVDSNYEYAFIQNPSVRNEQLLDRLKGSGTKVIYIYHEPWDSVIRYLKEGMKQTVKGLGAHFFSIKVLKRVDWVVVPSFYAMQLYSKKDRKYNFNVSVIPLLFEDEAAGVDLKVRDKEFFSYIGHAAKGHAFDEFIRFVRFALESGSHIDFLIATRTKLDGYLRKYRWLQEAIDVSRLTMFHGRPLTNEEINECYKRSFCVWNVYRRSTQSGVLPKAFMFGTPVMASKIGSFPEFVEASFNGEFVRNPVCFEEIQSKLTNMKKNIDHYSENARMSFMKTFYYKANLSRLESTISNC